MDASNQELQQYLFDLQGYLVIHNVLGAAEVAELNRLIDAQRLPSPHESLRFGSACGSRRVFQHRSSASWNPRSIWKEMRRPSGVRNDARTSSSPRPSTRLASTGSRARTA